MQLGSLIYRLLIAVVMSASLLSPASADAAAALSGHGDGHSAHFGVASASAPVGPSLGAAGQADEVVATDCHGAADDCGACLAGHCVQCAGVPPTPFFALDDRMARDRLAETPPHRAGRCTPPETPPRIA